MIKRFEKVYITALSPKKFLHTNNKDTYGSILGKKRYIKEFSRKKFLHTNNKDTYGSILGKKQKTLYKSG